MENKIINLILSIIVLTNILKNNNLYKVKQFIKIKTKSGTRSVV